MKDKEETIAHVMRCCQHYDPNGITMIGGKKPTGVCLAGVNYIEQFGGGDSAGIFLKIPCLQGNTNTHEQQISLCPKWLRSTREQGEQRYKDIEDSINRMRVAGPVISAWRNKPPIGKSEIIECPVCHGRLHLSQSAYNGHVHGRCETNDCLNWME